MVYLDNGGDNHCLTMSQCLKGKWDHMKHFAASASPNTMSDKCNDATCMEASCLVCFLHHLVCVHFLKAVLCDKDSCCAHDVVDACPFISFYTSMQEEQDLGGYRRTLSSKESSVDITIGQNPSYKCTEIGYEYGEDLFTSYNTAKEKCKDVIQKLLELNAHEWSLIKLSSWLKKNKTPMDGVNGLEMLFFQGMTKTASKQYFKGIFPVAHDRINIHIDIIPASGSKTLLNAWDTTSVAEYVDECAEFLASVLVGTDGVVRGVLSGGSVSSLSICPYAQKKGAIMWKSLYDVVASEKTESCVLFLKERQESSNALYRHKALVKSRELKGTKFTAQVGKKCTNVVDNWTTGGARGYIETRRGSSVDLWAQWARVHYDELKSTNGSVIVIRGCLDPEEIQALLVVGAKQLKKDGTALASQGDGKRFYVETKNVSRNMEQSAWWKAVMKVRTAIRDVLNMNPNTYGWVDKNPKNFGFLGTGHGATYQDAHYDAFWMRGVSYLLGLSAKDIVGLYGRVVQVGLDGCETSINDGSRYDLEIYAGPPPP